MSELPELSVSQFIASCNQTLEYAYPAVVVIGEVCDFKVSQGKWVFFDLKDESGSINCFMTLWNLRQPLQDGMKVKVLGRPSLKSWGRFSFTVERIQPVGEGNIKKSFELLKAKLEKEGLFDPAKKRELPRSISKIGVISSTAAAGYADFIKIIGERWGGLKIQTCHTQVQGLSAPDQIIRALKFLNERGEVDVIAVIRGGGSADDLSAFNDEELVRAIAASRIPVITGIGHEVDESLSDLAADVVASTPSNAAQMLTPDRSAVIDSLEEKVNYVHEKILTEIYLTQQTLARLPEARHHVLNLIESEIHKIESISKVLTSLNPAEILKKGYAIVHGKTKLGEKIEVETVSSLICAEVVSVKEKSG